MFSDGYPDQFGGPKEKKFMYKAFRRMLGENAHKPMAEQIEILKTAYNNWTNWEDKRYEQVDDITVIGICI
jgi:serine phosphatase RsbU (regulator of sigma subunit)